MNRLRLLLALAAFAVLAVPATAGAHSRHRGLDASHVCAKAARGKLPARVTATPAAVTAACAQLRTSLTTAQNAYVQAVAAPRAQRAAALQAARTACAPRPRTDATRAACRQAKQQAFTAIRALAPQFQAAARAYRTAVNAAFTAFWAVVTTR